MRLIHRFILRLIPLGLVAGVVAALFSSSSPLQSERIEAINPNYGPGNTYASGNFDNLSASEVAAQVEYVREVINWNEVETTQGTYNWSAVRPLDAVFTSEKSNGLKVVAVLSGGPTYLANAPGQPVDTTQFLVRWANFVQAAVDQFGDRVDVWEIGSQVNTLTGMSTFLIPSSSSASLQPDPTVYAQMIKVANKIIKAVDPNDEVWMGSLVSASSSQCALNPLTFLLEVNGAKAWSSIDSIQYTPARGAISPETAATSTNTSCTTSLSTTSTTLSAEVQSLQDLARQLGGKTVRIENLVWSTDELTTLSANRSISSDQVLADELVRASIPLFGSNGLTSLFWQVDPATQASAFTALSNLNSVLVGARFSSQAQGQSGSVFEYRFQKGSRWIIVAWRAQDGDNPIPVNLTGLDVSSLTAYAVDASSLAAATGTPIPVDASGNAIVMLNERPVLFLGSTSDLGEGVQQDISSQLDQWKFDLTALAHQEMNNAKAAMLQAVKDMFNSAKDKAVQWGEDKLNELLN